MLLNKKAFLFLGFSISLFLSIYNDFYKKEIIPNIDNVFVSLNSKTDIKEFKKIVKDNGGILNKSKGSAKEIVYRVYLNNNSKLVDLNVTSNTDKWIEVVFNKAKPQEITRITFFDDDKMIVGVWRLSGSSYVEEGYSLWDLNDQSIVHEISEGKYTQFIPVSSSEEIIDYIPSNENNHDSFINVLGSIQKYAKWADVEKIIEDNGLFYHNSVATYKNVSYPVQFEEMTERIVLQGPITRVVYSSYYNPVIKKRNGYDRMFINHDTASYSVDDKYCESFEEMIDMFFNTKKE